jgi:alanine racemase
MASEAVARIRSAALRHNLQRAREAAPGCPVMAVVKADAYGHGLVATAQALDGADAFGVARIAEALELRRAGIDKMIVVLSAGVDDTTIEQVREHDLQLVVYDEAQVSLLTKDGPGRRPLSVWLKIDSGMGRLGIAPERAAAVIGRLRDSDNIAPNLRLMTHLSCADATSEAETEKQLRVFGEAIGAWQGDVSIANSAAILGWPEAVRQGEVVRYSGQNWIRPGLMLYGVSPLLGQTAGDCGLLPVMSLEGRLLAVRNLNEGASVGYGMEWRAGRDSRIGVVNVGYADGYPWRLSNRATVHVAGMAAPVIGRVSMDMISIDLTEVPVAGTGDVVELWGADPSVKNLAELAGTSPYELLTGVGSRVRRHYE